MSRPRLREMPALPPSRWSGTDIRLLRRHLGISQSTLATILNCNRHTITAWERAGVAPIANGPVHRLLDMLDRDPERFSRWVT